MNEGYNLQGSGSQTVCQDLKIGHKQVGHKARKEERNKARKEGKLQDKAQRQICICHCIMHETTMKYSILLTDAIYTSNSHGWAPCGS